MVSVQVRSIAGIFHYGDFLCNVVVDYHLERHNLQVILPILYSSIYATVIELTQQIITVI